MPVVVIRSVISCPRLLNSDTEYWPGTGKVIRRVFEAGLGDRVILLDEDWRLPALVPGEAGTGEAGYGNGFFFRPSQRI